MEERSRNVVALTLIVITVFMFLMIQFNVYSRVLNKVEMARVNRKIEEIERYKSSAKRGKLSSLEVIISALEDKNERVRKRAAKIMEDIIGEREVDYYIEMMCDNDDYRDTKYAILIIGYLDDPRAVKPLTDLVNYNMKHRSAALIALTEIDDPQVVEPLIDIMLNHDSFPIREDAARALGEIGDPRAVYPLLYAVENDTMVRDEAVEALVKIGDPRALKPMEEMMQREPYLRYVLNKAYRKIEKSQRKKFFNTLWGDDEP